MRRSQARYHAIRQQKAREDGVCIWCRSPARGSGALCEGCKQQMSEVYWGRRDAGLCARCGVRPASGYACNDCRTLYNEQRNARRRRGA